VSEPEGRVSQPAPCLRGGPAPGWRVERATGPAAAFHARALPPVGEAERVVRVLEVDRAALVLGSTQPESDVDAAAVRAAGVDLVRRRSGGGAVLLEPGGALWVDVDLPAGDPRWRVDVAEAFHWLGEAWVAALAHLGIDGVAHRGPPVVTPWSRAVCFAGLGPGEVTVGGRKAVGMAQRRTRAAARFQCAVLQRWEPERLVRLLALPADGKAGATRALAGVATGVDKPSGDIVDAFLSALSGPK
jgi:lipoate-protein ligase A